MPTTDSSMMSRRGLLAMSPSPDVEAGCNCPGGWPRAPAAPPPLCNPGVTRACHGERKWRTDFPEFLGDGASVACGAAGRGWGSKVEDRQSSGEAQLRKKLIAQEGDC